MMGAINRMTQANFARAIRAAKAEGLPILASEIAPDGTIRFTHSEEADAPKDDWDRWKSKRHEN